MEKKSGKRKVEKVNQVLLENSDLKRRKAEEGETVLSDFDQNLSLSLLLPANSKFHSSNSKETSIDHSKEQGLEMQEKQDFKLNTQKEGVGVVVPIDFQFETYRVGTFLNFEKLEAASVSEYSQLILQINWLKIRNNLVDNFLELISMIQISRLIDLEKQLFIQYVKEISKHIISTTERATGRQDNSEISLTCLRSWRKILGKVEQMNSRNKLRRKRLNATIKTNENQENPQKWQWENANSNSWCDYSLEECKVIDTCQKLSLSAFIKSGPPGFPFCYYEINWQQKWQKNLNTQNKRKIRCWDEKSRSFSFSPPLVFQSVVPSTLFTNSNLGISSQSLSSSTCSFSSPSSSSSIFSQTSVGSLSLSLSLPLSLSFSQQCSQSTVLSSQSIQSIPVPSEDSDLSQKLWLWQYQFRGFEHLFHKDLNAKIEKAYQAGEKEVCISRTCNQKAMKIDLVRFTFLKIADSGTTQLFNPLPIRRVQTVPKLISNFKPPMFVPVEEGSKNWKKVLKSFQLTCPENEYKVLCIYNMTNQFLKPITNGLARSFKLKSKTKTQNKKLLWHGTRAEIAGSIQANGFNRDFNKNGRYGRGVYFAEDAKVASQYSHQDYEGHHCVLYCEAFLGDTYVGKQEHLHPFSKPDDPFETYDTRVDNLESPSIYVLCRDFQALPLFLVSFVKKE